MNFNQIFKPLFVKLFLAVGLVLGLAGCGGKKNTNTASKKTTLKSTAKTSSKTRPQPQPKKEPAIAKPTKQAREITKGVLQTDSGEASLEEMIAQVQLDIERERHLAAAQWLEKIIRRYPEHADIADFRYKHSQCLFLGQKFLSASQAYDEFVQLYPGDSRSHEARYSSLMGLYNYSKSLAVDCDSTETANVIKLSKLLLSDESMQAHHDRIAGVLRHCQDRLVNKDVAVFDSYIRRNKLEAAAARLEKIKSVYVEQAQELAPRITYLECKLASAGNNAARAKECLEMLEEQYADSKYAKMAASFVDNNDLFNNLLS